MQIKDDAIFIADTHYNYKRRELFELLENIKKGQTSCSQLFLMGDIFDFLSKEISYFKSVNSDLISLINFISEKCEVYYLEGNHDFNLKQLFPKVKVFTKKQQPILMKIDEKTAQLSHGDLFVGIGYELYCKLIRNSLFLKFLNFIDILGVISKNVEKKLANKKICHKIENFETLVKKRLENYSADIVIEGHYHQGQRYSFENQEYVNIPSLACEKKYVRYKDKQFSWED